MSKNLPNLVTLARLLLLPLVVALIWPGTESPKSAFWAAVAYVAAGILDVLDGALARRINQVTVLGKFLDPLADKLFYLVTMIALLQLPGDRIPAWVVMFVLVRELAITGLRGMAMTQGLVIAADLGGKVKTSLATAGMVGLLVYYPYDVYLGPIAFVLDSHAVGLFFTYVSLGFSFTSAVGYVRQFLRIYTLGA